MLRTKTCLLGCAALLGLVAGTGSANCADSAATVAAACDADGWRALFNGKDTDGWIQRGGKAKYTVVDGVLVGTSVAGTPNSFLCPPGLYGDFEMELEFLCDPNLNSGIQIRSESKVTKSSPNQPYGYQVEIDMDAKRARWWTAGIYDENRRGWIAPLRGDKAAEAAFTKQGGEVSKPGEWNKIRIVAQGDNIQTFLNGVPRVNLKDGKTLVGFIGFQVHSVSKANEGKTVKFRNIRIKGTPVESPATAAPAADASAKPVDNTLTQAEINDGWTLLWNGKDSTGWRSDNAKNPAFPTKGWTMKDGVLTVLAKGKGGNIITEKRYSDFELSVDFKMTPGANSGIKYFFQVKIGGPEFQILDDALHHDAKKGKNGNRTLGSLYDLIPPAKNRPPATVGTWHTGRIVAKGSHVEHWLDGVKVVEYDRKSDEFRDLVRASKFKDVKNYGEWADGHIHLQDHDDEVSFKNIKLRELK